MTYKVERDFTLLEKSLEIKIIAVGGSLAGYARFDSIGCEV